ncbi:MAG: hypothetical protein HC857_09475 [Synechococcales cyanobacterium RU_4_20]|nr:hypothetical protein [Synechococcales cyanobacterium RU_4_20]NJR68212.1 hypothetical protein [Synechococcales cyanobacterium CRU_2_2]
MPQSTQPQLTQPQSTSAHSSGRDWMAPDCAPVALAATDTPSTALAPRMTRFSIRSSWLRRVRSLLSYFLTRWISDTPESAPSRQRFWGGEKKRRRGRPEETKGAGSRSV